MNTSMSSALLSSAVRVWQRALGALRLMAVSCFVLTCMAQGARAAAVDCTVYAKVAQAAKERTKNDYSLQEAATKEALDAAKECLANIDRILNGLIPGVKFSIDFSGILRGMINRACQVVTTKISAAGQAVTGTYSDAANRVIGGVGGSLPPGVVSGGVTSGGASPSGAGVDPSGPPPPGTGITLANPPAGGAGVDPSGPPPPGTGITLAKPPGAGAGVSVAPGGKPAVSGGASAGSVIPSLNCKLTGKC